tara:strand:- start:48415 stop:49215 length:801 start_codon:yes stop_codon:yes gene_type:complete
MSKQVDITLTDADIRSMPDSVVTSLIRAYNKRKARKGKVALTRDDLEFSGEAVLEPAHTLTPKGLWWKLNPEETLPEVGEAISIAQSILNGQTSIEDHITCRYMELTHAQRDGIKPSSVYGEVPQIVLQALIQQNKEKCLEMVKTRLAELQKAEERLKKELVRLKEYKAEQEKRRKAQERVSVAKSLQRLRMLNRTAAEKLGNAVTAVAESTLPDDEKDRILDQFRAVVADARQWADDLRDFQQAPCGGPSRNNVHAVYYSPSVIR